MNNLPIYLQDGKHVAHQWQTWLTGEILVQWWVKSEPRQDKYITFDSLAEYHPQFPAAMRALLGEKRDPEFRKSAYNEEVVGTLEVLRRGTFSLRDLDGETCEFSRFRALNLEGHGVGGESPTGVADDIYEITGLMVSLEYTVNDGHEVPYVKTSTECSTFVHASELNERFPGWSNRWLAGQGLGLPEDELMEYTFNAPNLAPTDKSNFESITFG